MNYDPAQPGKQYSPPLPPRTHLTHPHGVQVHQMIDQMFSGIARAAGERGMRFHCTPEVSDTPGRQRDTSVVYRQQFVHGTIQVPLLQCLIDLTHQHPERKAAQHHSELHSTSALLTQLDQFTQTHRGSIYGGCGLLFDELAKLFRSLLQTAGRRCVGRLCMWPQTVPGDDRDRDMAMASLVLRDELEENAEYDYQITLIWNGPDRFQRLLFRALDGHPPA